MEQLQRAHLRDLAEIAPGQRHTYQMIFGDPLDWIRRRLGHASAETTQIYLHALAELELATRQALVPGDWEPAHSQISLRMMMPVGSLLTASASSTRPAVRWRRARAPAVSV